MQLYRTLVQLDDKEKQIVHAVRQFMRKENGKLPPQTEVIRAIIRDYWNTLVELRGNDPKSPAEPST